MARAKRALCTALAAGLLLVCCRTANAETVQQGYQRGLKAYYAGHHAEAVRAFERIVALPLRHEQLFYNLGCAYYRLGKLGPAIYNFERALELDPSLDDARYNLDIARAKARSRVKDVVKGAGSPAWWVRTARALTPATEWTVFLVLWWTALGLLLALRYVAPGPLRAGLIAANAFAWLLVLCSGALLAARIYLANVARDGIILPDRIAVREGPDPQARASFKLHAGMRVRLRGDSGDWTRIRLPNGLEGWVRRGQLGRL